MQKLEKRNTYTPTDASQVCSNCDSVLNREFNHFPCKTNSGLSVQNLKTFSNNLDVSQPVKRFRSNPEMANCCKNLNFSNSFTELKTQRFSLKEPYKKLIVTSENEKLDVGLESIYEKISRKKQGSKAFKHALSERDNKINQSINQKDFTNVKEVVCEDLKNVKHKSKKKIYKKFNNKLQRWSYRKVLDKLEFLAEEKGFLLTKIDPSYTSQKCSNCGVIGKNNRKGEKYQCSCGLLIDADYNAAINISHMGVYSPHALCNKC